MEKGGKHVKIKASRLFAFDSVTYYTNMTQPTGALNRTSSDEVMEELAKLNSEGTTIMLVTHDVKVAAKCTRVMYIVDGNIRGEYDLSDYSTQMRQRERALNNWLLELGW